MKQDRQDIQQRKLRVGIVGGGQGAFIGGVHRMAVTLDGQAEVVAGALSANPRRAAESARAWYLQRSYNNFEEMAATERMRYYRKEFGKRVETFLAAYPISADLLTQT